MSDTDIGRSPSGPGSRASHGAADGVSAVPASIPSAMMREMDRYLDLARAEGKKPTRFIMAECLAQSFSPTGIRPARYRGVRIEGLDTWRWGWMLYVGMPVGTRYTGTADCPFEPAEGETPNGGQHD